MNEVMNTNAVEGFTDEAMRIAEEEFQMTPEELAYNKKLIAHLAKELERRDNEKKVKRAIKSKRRAANKVARQSRRTNRK